MTWKSAHVTVPHSPTRSGVGGSCRPSSSCGQVRQDPLRLLAIPLDLARRMPNHVGVSSPPHDHKVKIAAMAIRRRNSRGESRRGHYSVGLSPRRAAISPPMAFRSGAESMVAASGKISPSSIAI